MLSTVVVTAPAGLDGWAGSALPTLLPAAATGQGTGLPAALPAVATGQGTGLPAAGIASRIRVRDLGGDSGGFFRGHGRTVRVAVPAPAGFQAAMKNSNGTILGNHPSRAPI